MFCKSYCASTIGVDACIIQVEADVTEGLPVFQLVGLLSSEVREARERVRSTIKNMGWRFPPKRVTVNLSPADFRKEGTGFDLAIAVSLLCAFGYLEYRSIQGVLFIGELSLDGHINAIPGVLAMLQSAVKGGFHYAFVPKDNENEARMIQEIKCIPVDNIKEVLEFLICESLDPFIISPTEWDIEHYIRKNTRDFCEVSGQYMMKRAAEIAVSGGHNLLMVGPPGAGKTMIAERIPSIMPMLSREQSLEVARIFSVYGDMKNGGEYIYERPFRSPHHSIPPTALVGGGVTPKPGEISLAHHGVLFLDELTEFQRRTIEMLRLPLEQKRISHCRNNISLQFPSDFMLIAAMNPCPCGYFPNKLKCQCTPAQIQRYLSKLSYALLDRIDIVAQVEEISYQMICNGNIENESSEVIRKRVEAACLIQEKRYNKEGITKNAQMDLSHIQKWCQLEEDANSFFKDVFQARNLTSRGYFRILRVARTIADLESSECVLLSHIQEAVAYRLNDKDYMNNREGLL